MLYNGLILCVQFAVLFAFNKCPYGLFDSPLCNGGFTIQTFSKYIYSSPFSRRKRNVRKEHFKTIKDDKNKSNENLSSSCNFTPRADENKYLLGSL